MGKNRSHYNIAKILANAAETITGSPGIVSIVLGRVSRVALPSGSRQLECVEILISSSFMPNPELGMGKGKAH